MIKKRCNILKSKAKGKDDRINRYDKKKEKKEERMIE